MTAGSGRQCSMLLEQSSRLGAFSRILLASSHWTNSAEYCYVWQIWDTRSGFSAFRLTQSGQSTCESECSLLGTANASVEGPNAHTKGVYQTLDRIRLWPTPRKEGYDRQGKGHGDLQYEVKHRLLPTPEAKLSASGPDYARANREGSGGDDLVTAIHKLWPTPTSRDHKDGTSCTNVPVNCLLGRAVNPSPQTGSLNPDFVEALMMFPIGHTRLRGSECQTERPG